MNTDNDSLMKHTTHHRTGEAVFNVQQFTGVSITEQYLADVPTDLQQLLCKAGSSYRDCSTWNDVYRYYIYGNRASDWSRGVSMQDV